MTVVRPNSIAGINSITVQTGQALNIHDASGNLIRNITSSTGISTFQSVEITKGTGDLTVGVSTFFVDNSATNVGVGTNVPYNNAGTNVHIHSANTTSEIRFTNSTTGGGNNGGTIQQGGTTLYVSNSEAGNIAFENNGSERVRIDSSGQLVIGSTSGEAKLDVTGGVSISSNGVTVTPSGYDLKIRSNTSKLGIHCDSGAGTPTLEFGTGGSTGCFINDLDATPMRFGTHNTERMRIRGDGRISIGSSLAVTGVCTAAAFIPSMGQLSHRNLIINGAMAVNQYGTSSTSSGIKHIDRWAMYAEGANTTLTQSKVDVAAGTAPYQLGFRSAFKILNAGQSNSNVGGDTIRIEQHIEDQMLARSGWDYKSSSSYLTLSFWVKSSVAQDFVITLMNRSDLGTSDIKTYSQNFTISSADTWTKITTKIPGSSSLTLDNDNTRGLTLAFYMFMGNDDTDGSHTDGAWQAYNGADLAKQQTITWWTTSNSTVEYTGVQLEVGEYATPFEHCGYDNELLRCQRYYQKTDGGGCGVGVCNGTSNGARIQMDLKTTMRANPTVSKYGNNIYIYDGSAAVQVSTISQTYGTTHSVEWEFNALAAGDPLTAGRPVIAYINGSAGGLQMTSEL